MRQRRRQVGVVKRGRLRLGRDSLGSSRLFSVEIFTGGVLFDEDLVSRQRNGAGRKSSSLRLTLARFRALFSIFSNPIFVRRVGDLMMVQIDRIKNNNRIG